MQAAFSPPSDGDVQRAIGALFAAENRRMLGKILADAPQPPEPATTPVAATLPAALRAAVTSVNSAGEGRGVYPALQDHPRLQALVNAGPDRVERLAATALTQIPEAAQPHQTVVQAAFSRQPAKRPPARPRLQLLVLQGGGA
jgi:hypothetical protein